MAANETECVCPLCRLMNLCAGSKVEKHFKAAHREFLLGLRSILDHRIDVLGDGGEGGDTAREVEIK